MDVAEKIKLLEDFAIEKGVLKPSRKLFVVKPEDIRKIFESLVEKSGHEGFYLSTIVGTDLKEENKIRLDYYIVMLPEEETVVVRAHLPRENPVVDSIIDIVPGALAGECETYDLLGVVFRGNPFLKRSFFVPTEVSEKEIYPLRRDSGV